MQQRQFARAAAGGGRSTIQPVLQDRLNAAVGAGADLEPSRAGRFQPFAAVAARQVSIGVEY
jgi:hypothetical protein